MEDKIYFAAAQEDKIASEILDRVEDYQDHISKCGQLELWNKSYSMYYRGGLVNGSLRTAGEADEYLMMDVNHYKSILTNILNMTTNQRPALDPIAVNTDTESIAQTKLAKSLLDFYMRNKKVANYMKSAVKSGLIYGEGIVLQEWDQTSGTEYGVTETGAVVTDGDIKFSSVLPHFLTRDYTKQDWEKHDWFITTTFENKYDLAAKYPQLKEKILELSYDYDFLKRIVIDKTTFEDSDNIPVYTLFHKKNSVMPQGRLTQILSDDVVLFDGPTPYPNLPVYRLAPEQQDFSSFGYTVGFDLLAIQEAVNNLYSTVATNQSIFGVQSILIPRGFNISIDTLGSGLQVIEYDSKLGKPEPMNLTLTAPEIFNFINQLETLMEKISGVNSVSRGDPQASLKSGNALALIQSMAIQFNSGLQQSYVELMEQIGTGIIVFLQNFASTPRVALIAGKYNKSYMKEFTGENLSKVQRVLVDVGNPLSKTLSGKMQIADNLLQAGFIKDAEQYITVLETGTLDPVLEGPMKEQYQIRQENELMAQGEEMVALITDSHAQHIQEHKTVLSSPESRKDPEIIRVTLAHIMEHIAQLKTADPVLLKILGQEAIQAPAPAGNNALPPGGQAPSGEVPMVEPVTPVTAQAAQTRMPSLPKNPLTGQQFDIETGGLPQ